MPAERVQVVAMDNRSVDKPSNSSYHLFPRVSLRRHRVDLPSSLSLIAGKTSWSWGRFQGKYKEPFWNSRLQRSKFTGEYNSHATEILAGVDSLELRSKLMSARLNHLCIVKIQ